MPWEFYTIPSQELCSLIKPMETNCVHRHSGRSGSAFISVTRADITRSFIHCLSGFSPQCLCHPEKWRRAHLISLPGPPQKITTDCVTLGGLNDRNLFSHSTAGWKSEVKVSAGLFPLKPHSLPDRWLSSSCVFAWSSLYSKVKSRSVMSDSLRPCGL